MSLSSDNYQHKKRQSTVFDSIDNEKISLSGHIQYRYLL
jgi:hypothetical protein